MKSKRIAVIGGGFCGIVSIATLKNEGLEPVCFERSNKFGGTWCYRQETRYAEASIMPTTIINHSKEMGAISNFPPRKEFNNYMKHNELYQYINEYVKYNDCEKYINYNTEVMHVKRTEDYAETGCWSVTTKNSVTGTQNTDVFDGVLVCTGHINMSIIPKFNGQDMFRGNIMHTHSLKKVDGFENQTVVVVGTGCSALDAAVEISRVAKQVHIINENLAMRRKKIAVIGGGLAGIVSIHVLKSDGLEPVCFEKSEKYGGTWCYRNETKYGQASIMPTTIINHSKEMGALSNFPPKKEYSNYMKHSDLFEYLSDYAKTHDCLKYMQFNTEVLKVKRTEDYPETGQWYVTTKNYVTGRVDTDIFDGVLICTGHINMPIIPEFPGKDVFKGKIMHSHSLKEVDEFVNKNVVVVGTGCSALDAAVETSRVAKQVYLSTRTGTYVLNRVGPNGYPIDSVLLRRIVVILLDLLPAYILSWYLETFYINTIFDQKLCRVESKHHILSKEPVLNDHIGSKLLSGSVMQKGNIKSFTENGVIFRDEESVTEVDAVIMATGYTWGYPFLEEGVIVKQEGRINLYKCMYPPNLPHPTLAIIGFLNPFGPGFPLGEMQIRWASYLLSTNGKLPHEDVMMKDIVKRHNTNSKRYHPSEKLSVRVDYVQYMDEIAKELGVKPKIWKYLFTDFPLFIKVVFGPTVSYQYRLEGHGKWEGARDAVMTSNDRMLWPLRKGKPVRKGLFERTIAYILNLMPLNIYVCNF